MTLELFHFTKVISFYNLRSFKYLITTFRHPFPAVLILTKSVKMTAEVKDAPPSQATTITNLCWQGRLSAANFFVPILLSLYLSLVSGRDWIAFLLYFGSLHVAMLSIQYFVFRPDHGFTLQPNFVISSLASLLSGVFSVGLNLFLFGPDVLRPFGAYMCLLSFFHFSEYFTAAWIKPESLNTSSYLLNNGQSYWLALAVSWIEYFIVAYYLPVFKTVNWLCCFGIVLSILGEVFRKSAMLTAGSNFDHIIQNHKRANHRLVKHGIYSWFRHPSYVGWLLWAVGTQLVLLNPICLLTYTVVTWHFFNQRIYSEEISLLNFFGHEYMDYQKRVRTGIPFVTGYIIEPLPAQKKSN